ncbi:MAG: aldo/keto reductase [Bryobacteraceae bacterium]
MNISRRQFLESAALAAAAARTVAGAAPIMPTRVLGSTGVRVSILAFGAGSRFLSYQREEALAILSRALDAGVNYIDTCENYGKGESESRIGELMPARRGDVFLATKLGPRGYDDAMRTIEASLKRLRTGCVDLVHIHNLQGAEDVEKIGAKGGAYEALLKIREQKMTRFIGITSHTDPGALKTALERFPFDCTQIALNAAQRGGLATGMNAGFETLALPVAVSKKIGIIAMKAFAQDELKGQAPAGKLIYYCLSLPIATVSIGMPTREMLDQNIALAKAFQPLPAGEMDRLSTELSGKFKASLDGFFHHHIDA